MNIVWIFLIAVSIVAATATGRLEALTKALFEGARIAVETSLFLLGIVALWLGITKIIEASGLIHHISSFFRPFITRLFRAIPADHPAMGAMVMNISANMLGLGNAATPLGIRAMQEPDTLNSQKGTATNAMALFLAINTSGVTLLPTGIIALRAAAGSHDAAGIVPGASLRGRTICQGAQAIGRERSRPPRGSA